LFVQRAEAVRHDFQCTEDNARIVADICIRLDGLPLAIELAAARVKVLPPAAILARLDHRLTLLTGGGRDQPARHQTLRAALAWSYDLLAESHRMLFRHLGLFAGGWSLPAAEVVSGMGNLQVLDGLAALVDHSLVRQERLPDGEPRFRMLETVRELALGRLAAAGEGNAAYGRHVAYFRSL